MPRPTDFTREHGQDEDAHTFDGDAHLRDDTASRPTRRARDAGTFGAGLLLGLAIGAGIAILFAPQSGDVTRAHLGHRARHLRGRVTDRWEDLRDDVRRSARRGRRKLNRTLVERAK